jgi:hypothetical protein
MSLPNTVIAVTDYPNPTNDRFDNKVVSSFILLLLSSLNLTTKILCNLCLELLLLQYLVLPQTMSSRSTALSISSVKFISKTAVPLPAKSILESKLLLLLFNCFFTFLIVPNIFTHAHHLSGRGKNHMIPKKYIGRTLVSLSTVTLVSSWVLLLYLCRPSFKYAKIFSMEESIAGIEERNRKDSLGNLEDGMGNEEGPLPPEEEDLSDDHLESSPLRLTSFSQHSSRFRSFSSKIRKTLSFFLPHTVAEGIVHLENLMVISCTLFFCFLLIIRSAAPHCHDVVLMFSDWSCNPYQSVPVFPLDTAFWLILMPSCFSLVMKDKRIILQIFLWIVSLVGMIISGTIVAPDDWSATGLFIFFYMFTSVVIALDSWRTHYYINELYENLKTSMNETQQILDQQKLRQMKDVIGNVSHDLKTVSLFKSCFICFLFVTPFCFFSTFSFCFSSALFLSFSLFFYVSLSFLLPLFLSLASFLFYARN